MASAETRQKVLSMLFEACTHHALSTMVHNSLHPAYWPFVHAAVSQLYHVPFLHVLGTDPPGPLHGYLCGCCTTQD
jgi:hypothetical protein